MRKIVLMSIVFFFVLGISLGCSSSSDDEGSSMTQEEEIAYLVEGIVSLIGSVFEGEDLPPGVTASNDNQNLTTTITLENVKDEDEGLTANGILNGVGTLSNSDTIMTITFTGTITLSGAQVSSMIWDMDIVAPWDSAENEVAGDPTSLTGTVTVDGVVYNLEDFDLLGTGSSSSGTVTDPQFVAAGIKTDDGKGKIVLSEDGTEWDDDEYVSIGAISDDLWGIGCDSNGNCVAVGDNASVVYSSNGTSWTVGDVSTDDSFKFRGVASDNSRWVAVNDFPDSPIWYSDDNGATWSEASTDSFSNGFYEVAYGDGLWFAASPSAQQYWSADGQYWTQIDIQASITNPGFFYDIAYGNNTWVGVGHEGLTAYSTDASSDSSWVQGNYAGGIGLSGAAFGNGRFIAVGDGINGSGTVLLVSDDNGQSWTEAILPADFLNTGYGLRDVAYGNSVWSAMTEHGDHIYSTDNGDTWQTAALDNHGVYAIAYRAR